MSSHESSLFPHSAVEIARVRADGPPAVRERRTAEGAYAERSSSNRGVNGQLFNVLCFIKDSLPNLFGDSELVRELRVVTEDTVMKPRSDEADLLYRDCVLEVVGGRLSDSEISRLRRLARSLVQQLSESAPSADETAVDLAPGFLKRHVATTFSPDTNSADKVLMTLLGKPIAKSFCLKIPDLEDLPMDGKFLGAPEGVDPATERILKGYIGAGNFLLKKKRELVLLADASGGKRQERFAIEYHDIEHETMVYPLLRQPEQIVYLRVKSSRVRRANGTTSNPYELVEVLTAAAADAAERNIAGLVAAQSNEQRSSFETAPEPSDVGNCEGPGEPNTREPADQERDASVRSFAAAPYHARHGDHDSEELSLRVGASWPINSPAAAAAACATSQPYPN